MTPLRPFHLAFPVLDIETTRRFYVDLLGCTVGRESERWIDFDLQGHQLSAHVTDPAEAGATNRVDGEDVPVRHFGVILTLPEWRALEARLRAAGARFLIEPQVRFAGQVGEQATMFLKDPSGNALEFKAFADDRRIFAR